MSSNRPWDGTLENSKEYDRSVEQALLDTMAGIEIGKASDDGGLIKSYGDGSFEIFGPSNGPKGHYHLGRDANGNYYGHG